jgi:WD40 repeat protein
MGPDEFTSTALEYLRPGTLSLYGDLRTQWHRNCPPRVGQRNRRLDIERRCAVRAIDLSSCGTDRPVQVSAVAVLGDVTAAVLTTPVAGDNYCLSVGNDGTIRSWRLRLGEDVPHRMVERNQRASALAIADVGDLGQVIITGGEDSQIRIWSPHDGSTVGKPLSGNGYAMRTLATMETSAGTYVGALHQNRKLRIWNLATGRAFTEITPVEAFAFTVLGDARPAVAVRTAFNALEVYNLASSQWSGKPTPLHEPSGAENRIVSVSKSDGEKIIPAPPAGVDHLPALQHCKGHACRRRHPSRDRIARTAGQTADKQNRHGHPR